MQLKNESVSLPYVAGLFDGEGTVTLGIKRRKGKPSGHRFQVEIYNGCLEALNQVKTVCGGTITIKSVKNRPHKSWKWSVEHKKAESFLTNIAPFCVIKKKELELALKFRKTVKHGRRSQTLAKTQEKIINQFEVCQKNIHPEGS